MLNIAFYLPQFHTEVLNNDIWGEDFTDWVTSQNTRPIFQGHVQPKIPAGGLYDLLDNNNTLAKHCKQARNIGLNGFCFYFYSFDENLNALRAPVLNYYKSDIDFPYCLAWANHSWTKAWVGDPNTLIANQRFDDEHIAHFAKEIVPYFYDDRYIKIDERPVVVILNTKNINLPHLKFCIERFSGSKFSPFLVTTLDNNYIDPLIDLFVGWPPGDVGLRSIQKNSALKRIFRWLGVSKYFFKYTHTGKESELMTYQIDMQLHLSKKFAYSQTILTGWDNTPRYGVRGYVIRQDDASKFLKYAKVILSNNMKSGVPITFFKAWNEWAEGNVIEDKINDCNYSNLIKDLLTKHTIFS